MREKEKHQSSDCMTHPCLVSVSGFLLLLLVFSSSRLNLAELSSSISAESVWQLIFCFHLGFSTLSWGFPRSVIPCRKVGQLVSPLPTQYAEDLAGVPVQICWAQQEDEMLRGVCSQQGHNISSPPILRGPSPGY